MAKVPPAFGYVGAHVSSRLPRLSLAQNSLTTLLGSTVAHSRRPNDGIALTTRRPSRNAAWSASGSPGLAHLRPGLNEDGGGQFSYKLANNNIPAWWARPWLRTLAAARGTKRQSGHAGLASRTTAPAVNEQLHLYSMLMLQPDQTSLGSPASR